jgi:hypothetical protein
MADRHLQAPGATFTMQYPLDSGALTTSPPLVPRWTDQRSKGVAPRHSTGLPSQVTAAESAESGRQERSTIFPRVDHSRARRSMACLAAAGLTRGCRSSVQAMQTPTVAMTRPMTTTRILVASATQQLTLRCRPRHAGGRHGAVGQCSGMSPDGALAVAPLKTDDEDATQDRKGGLVRTSLVDLPFAIAAAFLLGRATAPGAAPAAPTARVFTGRAGDAFRVPASATRCVVSQEGGAANTICRHTPLSRARYSVVFYRDNLFVYRNGRPDNPVFSAKGRP